MYEQWHPLGPVGVITAFNFPVAVWSWNAFLAMVCGDTVVWKPSSKAALSAIATMRHVWPVLKYNNQPDGLLNLIIGDRNAVGEALIHHRRVPLVSATSSVGMGRHIAAAVASRLGKTILEFGGNNAVIVTPQADLDLAVRGVVFGTVGTAGQRCTTTRRVIVHRKIYTTFRDALVYSYKALRVGHPLEEGVHMGPLINSQAVKNMQAALRALKEQGGRVIWRGEPLAGGIFDSGTYVTPCIAEAGAHLPIVREETFAPILYVIPYDDLKQALAYQNEVPQGLSLDIFTRDLREAELFFSLRGSDCGMGKERFSVKEAGKKYRGTGSLSCSPDI